jgi:hypothetical protein
LQGRHAERARLRYSIVCRGNALPDDPPVRWFARLLSSYYARWCTGRMVDDAVANFASPSMIPGGGLKEST